MKKIVKGNDFTMWVIVNKIVDGEQQPFSLPACEEVKAFAVGRYRRYELETRVDAKNDSVLLVRVEGDKLPLDKYALEVKGKLFGNDWRSNEYCQFALVDSNAEADTEFRRDLVEGEDSVEMDTAIVFLPPEAGLAELADRFKVETLKDVKAETDRLHREFQSVTDAEAERVSNEKVRIASEGNRIENEDTRISNEKARIDSETVRIRDEKTRIVAEDERADAESARAEAEKLRADAETKRIETDKEIMSTLEYVNAQKYIKENEYEREIRAIEAIKNAPKDPTQDVWLDATDGEIKSGPTTENLTKNAITYYYLGKRVIKGTFSGATKEGEWTGNPYVRHLDVRNWDMTLCNDASLKFYGYSNLVSLDTSNWNLSALTNGDRMFSGCSSLQTLDTSNWNLSALTSGDRMFYGCNSLQTLDFRKSTFRNVTNFSSTFGSCNILAELWLPLTFDKLNSINLSIPSWGSTPEGLASLRWTFGEGADDRTAKGLQPCTVKLHANVYDRLTDEERAAAAKKGWTITK